MASFGLASANFGALAMQPLGHIAGTASSVQGTIGTICGRLARPRHRPELQRHDDPDGRRLRVCGVLAGGRAWASPKPKAAPDVWTRPSFRAK